MNHYKGFFLRFLLLSLEDLEDISSSVTLVVSSLPSLMIVFTSDNVNSLNVVG